MSQQLTSIHRSYFEKTVSDDWNQIGKHNVFREPEIVIMIAIQKWKYGGCSVYFILHFKEEYIWLLLIELWWAIAKLN